MKNFIFLSVIVTVLTIMGVYNPEVVSGLIIITAIIIVYPYGQYDFEDVYPSEDGDIARTNYLAHLLKFFVSVSVSAITISFVYSCIHLNGVHLAVAVITTFLALGVLRYATNELISETKIRISFYKKIFTVSSVQFSILFVAIYCLAINNIIKM